MGDEEGGVRGGEEEGAGEEEAETEGEGEEGRGLSLGGSVVEVTRVVLFLTLG